MLDMWHKPSHVRNNVTTKLPEAIRGLQRVRPLLQGPHRQSYSL